MVQVLANPENYNPWAEMGRNLGGSITQGLGTGLENAFKLEENAKNIRAQKKAAAQKELYDLAKMGEEYKLKQKLEEFKQGIKKNNQQELYNTIVNGLKGNNPSQENQGNESFDVSNIDPETILAATSIDPNLGKVLQHANDVALRQKNEDRTFHTNLAKESLKEADQLRSSIPKKEMALNFARNAVETGDLGYFSPDKLAEATGIDLFRTAKGAQLITAGKENLLSNMGRVSARAQNIWFEQRLNSMFPKIGQSKEANLTVQEMLEGEMEMDQAYLKEFDRLSEEDEKKYGYQRKDISKRARDAVKPLEKEIMKRTTYRMKEIEEQEKGLTKLQSQVGKNVVKGTPLTLAMAKLYKEKFREKALDVAKKNGYYIPTLEEFRIFRMTPQESREVEKE